MRSHRLALATVLAAVIVFPVASPAQLVPGAPPTDWSMAQNEYRLTVLRDYNALITAWHTALNSGDTIAAAAAYADSAWLLVSGYESVQGHDSIAAFLGAFSRRLVEIRTGVADFLASDRLAYATGPMILVLRGIGSDRELSLKGQHVTVLVRDGKRWRIRSQVLKYEAAEPARGG